MSFEKIVNSIYKNGKILIDVNSDKFANLFQEQEDFRKNFYSYFSISGASLVLADSLEKRVILLQEDVAEAKGFPLLKIPVYPNELAKDIFIRHSDLNADEYNFLVNRIFQIQRKFQGLYDHEDDVTFRNVPEFFKNLPKLDDLKSSDSDETQFSYYVLEKHKLLYGFIVWRFLTWLNHKCVLDNILFSLTNNLEIHLNINKTIESEREYFSNSFLRDTYPNTDMPEFSIIEMDKKENWPKYENSFYVWHKLREKIDRVKKEFQEEVDIINKIVDADTLKKLIDSIESTSKSTIIDIDIVMSVLNHFVLSNKISENSNFDTCIKILHESIPLIISYYYFSLIDEIIKSHFVFSIWHSEYHPIEYITSEGRLDNHTSVLNCVVSLDSELSESKKIELITVFKLLTENVINSVFIERLIRAEQRKDVHQFQRNILLSSSEERKGIFILGSNEERITFIAQQSRAINLIRALYEFKIINKHSTVTIIGGGVSGVTAAIAAHVVGVKSIYLIEKEQDLLTLQVKATHRYIHPYIYDWPSTIYQKEKADIPFLGWKAGYAHDVLLQIKNAYYEFKHEHKVKNITEIFDCQVNSIQEADNDFFIPIKNHTSGVFSNIVILAVGQGPEKKKAYNAQCSYWEPDSLELPFSEPKRILIGGSGDGALIDLIRAKLKNNNNTENRGGAIQHKELFELTQNSSFRTLGQEMLRIDKDYISDQYLNKENIPDLFTLYTQKLSSSRNVDSAIGHMRKHYRESVAILHCNQGDRLKINTSLFNRLLAFLLHYDRRHSLVDFEKLEVIKCDDIGKKVRVSFDSNNNYTKIFDLVFLRFGTDENYLDQYRLGEINKTEQLFKLNLTNYISLDTLYWYNDLIHDKKTI